MERFEATDCWVFDLDNTLYPAECNLFLQVDRRMGEFISEFLGVSFEDARKVQKSFFRKYGTTLSGLMQEHGLDPKAFLDYVHDIDVSMLPEATELGAMIDRLPGRKFIFTNGSRAHAENVAGKLGILERFEDVFDIEAADYIPKPDRSAYASFFGKHGVRSQSAAMFEDMPNNLRMPHEFGMVTVLVEARNFDHPSQRGMEDWEGLPDHIHHVTDDLGAFLDVVLARLESMAE